MHVVYIIDRSE